jgi:diaminopimelate epimerase
VNFDLYDARGNRYLVASPSQVRDELGDFGLHLADNAAEAAAEAAIGNRMTWIGKISEHIRASGGEDGLLIGPFTSAGGIGLLIVNTATGELAERSGNGLTIFAKYLLDKHKDIVGSGPFFVTVHRHRAIEVPVEPTMYGGKEGFWIDMGKPRCGYSVVEADHVEGFLDGSGFSRVSVLADIDPGWTQSVFVSVDNPHCVTFLDSEAAVRSLDAREDDHDMAKDLIKIANSMEHGGDKEPFPKGINLQWACAAANCGKDSAMIHARVFERSEGWTDSSGSSATAVAHAAREVGFVMSKTVLVKMKHPDPLVISFDDPLHVKYFGVATKVDRDGPTV